MHRELVVDGDDALVQPLEQHPQTVAHALDVAERAAELAPHALEVVRERAELVAEAETQRRLEVAVRERLGRERQPSQPQRDQLREQQADDDADDAGDDSRAQGLAVHRADRLGHVGPVARRDERLAAIGNGGDERPPVVRACHVLAVGGHVRDPQLHVQLPREPAQV